MAPSINTKINPKTHPGHSGMKYNTFFNMSGYNNTWDFVCPSESDSDESMVFEPVTNGKVVPHKVSEYEEAENSGNPQQLVDLTPATFQSSPGNYFNSRFQTKSNRFGQFKMNVIFQFN